VSPRLCALVSMRLIPPGRFVLGVGLSRPDPGDDFAAGEKSEDTSLGEGADPWAEVCRRLGRGGVLGGFGVDDDAGMEGRGIE
jgi:hypothetical protein